MQKQKLTPGKGDRYYGKTAMNYEDRRRKQAWWHVEQQEMENLLDMLPTGLKVVDIPFGTGRFVPAYLERGHEIWGLDASADMLKAAEAELGPEFFSKCTVTTGLANELPYEDGQFDLLVSTRFLADIIPFGVAKQALAEFSRVTKKYAIIQLGHQRAGGQTPDDRYTMSTMMSAKAINTLLRDNGFSVVAKRLVKSSDEGESRIYHFLCEKP
jgi:ubiquinone/menaquinone biosynthesis C-methylase UbiE